MVSLQLGGSGYVSLESHCDAEVNSASALSEAVWEPLLAVASPSEKGLLV